MKYETYIQQAYWETYKQELTSVWYRLVYLNVSLLILKEIAKFPFRLFTTYPPLFWRTVNIALLEKCVLIIWNTSVDQCSEGFTIKQLKNKVFSKYLHPHHKSELAARFKKHGFESRLEEFVPKIRDIRHNFVAHYNYEENWNRPTNLATDTTSLQELSACATILNDYLNELALGDSYSVFPIEYTPGITLDDAEIPLDITKLLDSVARESSILNLPESNPVQWKYQKQALTAEDIEIINEYRHKFGLCSA